MALEVKKKKEKEKKIIAFREKNFFKSKKMVP